MFTLLLIHMFFIMPSQLELEMHDIEEMHDIDLKHCESAYDYMACVKEAAEKQKGGTYDFREMIIWSGLGTIWYGNNIIGGGGSDELSIRVHHLIRTIPLESEEDRQYDDDETVEYKFISSFSYWNDSGELWNIGVGYLDASNNFHVLTNNKPADEDEHWMKAKNTEDEAIIKKFGGCSESSDSSVEMCSWAEVSLAKNPSSVKDDDQMRYSVKICTNVYRVLANGPRRQRVVPNLGCVTLDDICTMQDPGCWSSFGNPKNDKLKKSRKNGIVKMRIINL